MSEEKIRVMLSGPLLTQSGYGVHSRFIYRALKSREDLFDIYAEPTRWGGCRWIVDDTEERRDMEGIFKKTFEAAQAAKGQTFYDVNIEVKLPTEWQQKALTNIGVTSGIETTKALQNWNDAADKMDLILVESEHAKSCFDTVCPIDMISFPERSFGKVEPIELSLETDFNFLLVSQIISRKNVEETILAFLEEFHDDENVGLIAKLSMGQDSLVEKEKVEKILKSIIESRFKDKKCKIYLVFGYLTPEQMGHLYSCSDAMISMTKGEGFGLPLFEAVCGGMPLVVPAFGGQKDFLTMPVTKKGKTKNEFMAAKVDYDLGKIKPADCWGTQMGPVMGPEQIWAYPKRASCRFKMRSMQKNHGSFKKKAKMLQEHVMTNLTKEKQYALVVEAIEKAAKENMF